jgi:hypothetical protein
MKGERCFNGLDMALTDACCEFEFEPLKVRYRDWQITVSESVRTVSTGLENALLPLQGYGPSHKPQQQAQTLETRNSTVGPTGRV